MPKAKIEARAAERFAREQAKMAKRQAKARSGKKPGGKPPSPPAAGPGAQDQVNLTGEDSRIMKVAAGGFEQCYNAQALVDTDSMLVVVPELTQATNDKEQVEPMLAQIAALPEGLNQPDQLLADTGFFSERNVQCCQGAGIEPLIAVGRDAHHPDWRSRFEEPAALARPATLIEQMKHVLKTRAGRAAYALCKQTVEPVFGIIKSELGFRQFWRRRFEHVRAEWTLVCLMWNLKRTAVLRSQ